MGTGPRAHRPAQAECRFSHLHAGFVSRHRSVHTVLAEGASPGLGRPRRGAAGADPRNRQRPAGTGGSRCGPHAQPGTHPAVHLVRTRLEKGAGPGPGFADHLHPVASGTQAGGIRHRHLLSSQGTVRPGHGPEQHHGQSQLFGMAAGRSPGYRIAAVHGRGQAPPRHLFHRPPGRRPAHVLRDSVAGANPGLGAAPERHHQPAGPAVHGRDLRLLAAHGQPAVQGAPC